MHMVATDGQAKCILHAFFFAPGRIPAHVLSCAGTRSKWAAPATAARISHLPGARRHNRTPFPRTILNFFFFILPHAASDMAPFCGKQGARPFPIDLS